MISIAGSVAIRPEMRAEAVERGLWMSRLSEAELGCRHYRFSADLADPDFFFLFEEWESEEALRAHFATPHMGEFSRVLPGLVASPPVVMRYDVGEARAL